MPAVPRSPGSTWCGRRSRSASTTTDGGRMALERSSTTRPAWRRSRPWAGGWRPPIGWTSGRGRPGSEVVSSHCSGLGPPPDARAPVPVWADHPHALQPRVWMPSTASRAPDPLTPEGVHDRPPQLTRLL
jgi:hypothetical protein